MSQMFFSRSVTLRMATAAFAGLGLVSVAGAATGGVTSSPYAGNGASGFDGALGKGSLAIVDTPTTITFTLTDAGGLNDDAVVFLDTKAGGLTDTFSLTDNGDGGRTAVSGYGGAQNPPTRSQIDFATGMTADYALSIEGGYFGAFDLSNGAAMPAITAVSQTLVSGSYSATFNKSDLGITNGTPINFVASYDATVAYRSNETIGDAVVNPTTPGDPSTGTDLTTVGNPGFNNLIEFTDFDTFTPTGPVSPEPASLSLLALGGMLCIRRRSR